MESLFQSLFASNIYHIIISKHDHLQMVKLFQSVFSQKNVLFPKCPIFFWGEQVFMFGLKVEKERNI